MRANVAALVETAAERLLDLLARRRAGCRTTPAPVAASASPATVAPEAPAREVPEPEAPAPEGRARVEIVDDETPRHPALTPNTAGENLDAMISRVIRGEQDVADLRAQGPDAIRRVMATFPGTLTIDPRQRQTTANPSAHGPLLRLCIELGQSVVEDLINYMESSHELTRLYAALCFQEIRDDRCLPGLARLGFDSSAEVRSVSTRVLETYSASPEFGGVLETVRDQLHSTNITRTLHAVRAAGVLRDVGAIPRLIELLGEKDAYLMDAIIESLCTITGRQLGMGYRWKNWYHDQGARHRVQWLISALAHKDRTVRAWSGEELRRITGAAIVFPADGDKGQREAAIRQWTTWWDREKSARMRR